MRQEQDEIEIDLREIFYLLKKKAALILSVTVLLGVIAGLYSYYMIDPLYSSTAKIYIITKSEPMLSISDLDLSSGLTADYIDLIQSRPVMEQVIEELKLNMTQEELIELLTISNPTDTRILNITVKYTDALMAQKIANTIVEVSKKQISDIMDTDEPSIVEEARATGEKVYPSNAKFVLIAAALGLIGTSGCLILFNILDDKVKTTDDIERYLGLTTLALIPDDMDGIKGANKKTLWNTLFHRKED